MRDETIIRMLQETCQVLSQMGHKPFPQECRYLQHSFDALLQAARANHPGDVFLNALPTISSGEPRGAEESAEGPARGPSGPHARHGGRREAVEVSAQEMQVLFAQLRIALESLQDENAGFAGGGSHAALPPPTATQR